MRRRSTEDLTVRAITLINPDTLRGPRQSSSSRRGLKALGVAGAVAGAGAAARLLPATLLLWSPLVAVSWLWGVGALRRLIEARDAWMSMKKLILGPHSLERLRSALQEWRSDYKHGGAQEMLDLARASVAEAALPLGLLFLTVHVIFYAVSHDSHSSETKFSVALACCAVDVVLFSLLYFAGATSDLMSGQREFVTSARLRLAETTFAWADSSETLKASMRTLLLHQGLSSELDVIEAFTSEQCMVVYGVALESGKATQFAGLAIAFLQIFWDLSLMTLTMTPAMWLALAACIVNMAPFAYMAIQRGV